MDFSWLPKVFSRRKAGASPTLPSLSPSFRNRVLMLCRDAFTRSGTLPQLWREAHGKLAYVHGRPVLTPGQVSSNPSEDVVTFLLGCSDEHFLDFLEVLFRTDACSPGLGERLVDPINGFFDLDNIPYTLTPYVWEKVTTDQNGRSIDGSRLVHYPQVIDRGEEATYHLALEPALTLLRDPRFASANAEFLSALADFRKHDYADALTKAGSAFESSLKSLCDAKGWPYDKNRDTAASLLKTVIARSGLDTYWEQPLVLIATLRNRKSSAHGAGSQPRAPSRATAEYALSATAAAMLFLAKECL